MKRYSLTQEFKITDENEKPIKNIKVQICAVENGVENGNMESVFKDMATGFVDYLHTEGKVESENAWDDLETMFSTYSEKDNKSKGWKGWFR